MIRVQRLSNSACDSLSLQGRGDQRTPKTDSSVMTDPSPSAFPPFTRPLMIGRRIGVAVAVLAAALAAQLVLLGADAAAQAPRAPAPVCGGEVFARGRARTIIDARTFVLDDGREVRLAAIEVPEMPQPDAAPAAPGGAAAKAALAALLAGAEVELRRADIASDRYGRPVAYAAVLREDGERSVQAALIAAGDARVDAQVGDRVCAAELLRREDAARRAKLGLWADPYYDVLEADDPAAVLAQRGRFALVEGRVLSVHESGATIYVNFGRRWTRDFTVTILKRNARKFAAAGLEPKRLAARRLRIRGWIEKRGGPWIEAAHPGQIETIDRE